MMKEKEFISIIKSTLNSKYIGDDCAYLKDMGIVITQDNLVENIHFNMKYITPYQLGYKSIMVNISDICASGAEPAYLTIAISLPKNTCENFIEEFYKGAKDAASNVQIVGGDITGSDKIFVSVTAIGTAQNRKISSRSNAKPGYKIIVSGEHGNSAKGLEMLLNNGHHEFILKSHNKQVQHDVNNKFINAHLMPEAQKNFSSEIAQNITQDYAMMDTSDGLADALIQIAKASGVTISINTLKIPHDQSVDIETVLYGGEDYQLIAAIPENFVKPYHTVIGEVKNGNPGIEIDGTFFENIEDKLFNHFKG